MWYANNVLSCHGQCACTVKPSVENNNTNIIQLQGFIFLFRNMNFIGSFLYNSNPRNWALEGRGTLQLHDIFKTSILKHMNSLTLAFGLPNHFDNHCRSFSNFTDELQIRICIDLNLKLKVVTSWKQKPSWFSGSVTWTLCVGSTIDLNRYNIAARSNSAKKHETQNPNVSSCIHNQSTQTPKPKAPRKKRKRKKESDNKSFYLLVSQLNNSHRCSQDPCTLVAHTKICWYHDKQTKEMGTEDKIGMRKKFLKVHLFHVLFFSHSFLATVKFWVELFTLLKSSFIWPNFNCFIVCYSMHLFGAFST